MAITYFADEVKLLGKVRHRAVTSAGRRWRLGDEARLVLVVLSANVTRASSTRYFVFHSSSARAESARYVYTESSCAQEHMIVFFTEYEAGRFVS